MSLEIESCTRFYPGAAFFKTRVCVIIWKWKISDFCNFYPVCGNSGMRRFHLEIKAPVRWLSSVSAGERCDKKQQIWVSSDSGILLGHAGIFCHISC